MKKLVVWAIVLIIVVFTMSGCGNSSNTSNITGKTRAHSAKDDLIKFYDFEWMTDEEAIDKKFDSDFGANSYYKKSYENDEFLSKLGVQAVNDKVAIVSVNYDNEDGNIPLEWEIGGQKIQFITIDYIMDIKTTQKELYHATYYFLDESSDTFHDLNNKLSALYGKTETIYDGKKRNAVYTDSNNNRVEIKFDGDTTTVSYYCGDLEDIITELRNEYRKNDSSNKGL